MNIVGSKPLIKKGAYSYSYRIYEFYKFYPFLKMLLKQVIKRVCENMRGVSLSKVWGQFIEGVGSVYRSLGVRKSKVIHNSNSNLRWNKQKKGGVSLSKEGKVVDNVENTLDLRKDASSAIKRCGDFEIN